MVSPSATTRFCNQGVGHGAKGAFMREHCPRQCLRSARVRWLMRVAAAAAALGSQAVRATERVSQAEAGERMAGCNDGHSGMCNLKHPHEPHGGLMAAMVTVDWHLTAASPPAVAGLLCCRRCFVKCRRRAC
jgi:hypothetical protein